MNILVCITHVPDTTSRIAFTNNNTQFDFTGVQFVIGPYDDYALAKAVELKESLQARVTVLHVGPADTEPTLRKALAIGADDAIRVDAYPTDSLFVAAQIAAQAKTYDLVLMGRESIDYNSGVVHAMTAQLLGWVAVSPVTRLELDGKAARLGREIEGGKEEIEAQLPLVLGCQEPIAEWKIPSMRGIMSARSKPLNVVSATAVTHTAQLRAYELPPPKSSVKMIDPERPEELIDLLEKEAKAL